MAGAEWGAIMCMVCHGMAWRGVGLGASVKRAREEHPELHDAMWHAMRIAASMQHQGHALCRAQASARMAGCTRWPLWEARACRASMPAVPGDARMMRTATSEVALPCGHALDLESLLMRRGDCACTQL
eukprot:300891-Chlamydomonas_euryale.AAC.12